VVRVRTVLLVEDEANQRLLYQMELGDEGYRVLLASDGEQALESVRRDRPDVVVLDLLLPGIHGLELLDRIMGLNPALPVVIHSAYESYKDEFVTWAADAYVVKSSDLDVLKGEIARVIKARQAEHGHSTCSQHASGF
jgi:DNA-binding NtrC family response regulator